MVAGGGVQVYSEGRMSQHLDKMMLGDCILAKGPKGRFQYQKNHWKHIGAPPPSSPPAPPPPNTHTHPGFRI